MIDKETITLVAAISTTMGSAVTLGWLAYRWIDTTLVKPMEQLARSAAEMKIEQANIKVMVSKISTVQEARTGEKAPIEELVHETHEMVQHLTDIQDAKFMLADQALFTCDGNGFLCDTNEEFMEVTGLRKEQAVGRNWLTILKSHDQDIFLKAWERLLERGIYLSGKYSGVDGRVFKIRAVKKPEKTDDIKIIMGTIKAV